MNVAAFIRRSLPLAALILVTACKEEKVEQVYQLVGVAQRDIVVSVSAAGTIEPVLTVEVKSKASGEIVEVRAETGDNVTRGNILVRVDPRIPRNGLMQAEADIEVAQAQLANSESQFARAEALYASQAITEQEYETARLNRANANAQLVRARRSLEDARISFEDTEVRAPANGVILARNVEVGTVITSATQGVSGGTVLLAMASLDTVQIRTLVDETDIGKIQPGLDVTINVDAFPNQPFRGQVLKIEPQALEQQNVTMFPVLIRIANDRSLLKPGMNAEVEIHVGERRGVLAIPNAALRTQRDVGSAASVLGLDFEIVQQQLAQAADQGSEGERRSTLGGMTADSGANENTVVVRGNAVELPEGLTRDQVQPILDKMAASGGGMAAMQSLSSGEQAIIRRVFGAMRGGSGGRPGGRRAGAGGQTQGASFQFGGSYIVFVMTPEGPTARQVTTGLTDLDYAEVVNGLTSDDQILILPSASLIQAQEQFQERMNRMTGGGAIPGMSSGRR
ncbi:MAG: efflux RND transporter periplasmic adaptor subunit [Gemmatimonadota bacterium]|nr:efflux RND transporter periplasmic adaptor subunit [Gemmatimonadota bacterium]